MKIEPDSVIQKMNDIRIDMESHGFYGHAGDCGNFAEALQRVLGGNICCSYENEGYAGESLPAHCVLKVRDKFIDANGEHPNGMEYLRQWGFNEAFPEDEEFITIECGSGYADEIYFSGIRDVERVDRLEKIIREHLGVSDG